MNLQNNTNWPPAYNLIHSSRAEHVRLKASIKNGLEIIVPLSYDVSIIPALIEKHRLWIEKNLQKINELLTKPHVIELPKEIKLEAIQQTWCIHYIKTQDKKMRIVARPNHEIVILGDIDNQQHCCNLLLRWLKDHAKKYLGLLLEEMSNLTSLEYDKLVIRDQKTRWGSCSWQKTISLNYKLLFLSPALAKHIIIHELCHTVHMDHSSKFWRLVASFDKNWEYHSKITRKAEREIPSWVSLL